MIRPAEAGDAQAIAALWSALIRDTAVTFNAIEKSPGDVTALLLEKADENLPFFVAIDCSQWQLLDAYQAISESLTAG